MTQNISRVGILLVWSAKKLATCEKVLTGNTSEYELEVTPGEQFTINSTDSWLTGTIY